MHRIQSFRGICFRWRNAEGDLKDKHSGNFILIMDLKLMTLNAEDNNVKKRIKSADAKP